jgi:hypothetical protein
VGGGGRRVGGGGRMERGGFDECFSKNKINGLVNGEPGISLSVRKRISCFFKIALSWVKYILHQINRYWVEYDPTKAACRLNILQLESSVKKQS